MMRGYGRYGGGGGGGMYDDDDDKITMTWDQEFKSSICGACLLKLLMKTSIV